MTLSRDALRGETCAHCNAPAEHKIEEVLFDGDPPRHPLTQYLCGLHFLKVMRPWPRVDPTDDVLTLRSNTAAARRALEDFEAHDRRADLQHAERINATLRAPDYRNAIEARIRRLEDLVTLISADIAIGKKET